jgi:hypothetical protein
MGIRIPVNHSIVNGRVKKRLKTPPPKFGGGEGVRATDVIA